MSKWPFAPMNDAFELLNTPLGVPGSGRVRYGAAMEFYCRGLISEDQLNVYLEAAAYDARDPVLLLVDRGLPPLPLQDVRCSPSQPASKD